MKTKLIGRNQVPSANALTSLTAGSINIHRRLIGLALIGSFLALATGPRVFGQGMPVTESDLVAQILANATGGTTPLTDGDYNATGVTGDEWKYHNRLRL